MYNIASIGEGHQTVPIYWVKAMLMNCTPTQLTQPTHVLPSYCCLLLLTLTLGKR
jgi:hypothetical protein